DIKIKVNLEKVDWLFLLMQYRQCKSKNYGYKSTSLFKNVVVIFNDKLIFINARNISSRFFNFKIKKSTKVDYAFCTRSF
ncbi:hypothetical protein, partial [Pseudomonas nunensis]|uniref:hypothetical protein n=1 Tax=Pseudomonas nunensis TaxID=2961896 RepID=UPI0025B1EAB8